MKTGQPACNLLVIRSPDINRAVRFYETLGLSFTKHSHGNGPEHYASETAGFVFEIYPARSKATTTETRIGFRVADVDNVIAALSEIDAKIRSEPTDSEWGRRAVVCDFDGHTVELVS
ncbi:VOC family protein [Stieleria sp. ICT_E10.1]|uniref:VOC family protein n=1 Tax=Stieleria sedimenti TaxID=2976331 RepID=UPI0021802225|nr:VOC family protein [Stieleria sedimenti]MCS7470337.1 VOC family protein [Stieleria sedimenti]